MRSARWWCALCLVVGPAALLFLFVGSLGVNTLIADEFVYVPFIRLVREGGAWTSWLFLQHNEHRVLPMKLVMAFLQGPTRWSQLAEMFVSASLSAAIVAVFWGIHRACGLRASAGDLLAFAPIAWLLSSLSQYESQFFGMMMCHYFTALGASLALWSLTIGGAGAVLLAWFAASVAAFSIGTGFLIFPAGAIILAARRASVWRWAVWSGGGIASLAWYLRGYLEPAHPRPLQWSFGELSSMAWLALTTLGAPVAAGSAYWGGVAGAGLIVIAAVLIVQTARSDSVRRERRALAISLVVFGLGCAVMVGVGRLAAQGSPVGSRYITYSNFAWVGVYLLILQHVGAGGDPRWRVGALTLLLPAIAASSLHGLATAREWHEQRLLDQYILQTFDLQPDRVLARLGTPSSIRQHAAYLRAEGLSAFAEPQRLMMFLVNDSGIPTGEILSGRGVEQRLRCPVDDLHDLGVVVLPASRSSGKTFSIRVTSGSQQLANVSTTVATVMAWTWVRLPLRTPYRDCLGADLTLRIESQSTEPETGVFVLAAEPTYDGTLTQAGQPIVNRRLALALNAFRAGLLR
jgi:hypothetical protein